MEITIDNLKEIGFSFLKENMMIIKPFTIRNYPLSLVVDTDFLDSNNEVTLGIYHAAQEIEIPDEDGNVKINTLGESFQPIVYNIKTVERLKNIIDILTY